jgi:hypothetical protein
MLNEEWERIWEPDVNLPGADYSDIDTEKSGIEVMDAFLRNV